MLEETRPAMSLKFVSDSNLLMRVGIVQAGDSPEGWRIRAWPL